VPEVIDLDAIQKGRRAMMRLNPRRPMTADEFLYAYEGIEGRWELVDGVPVMMAGASRAHNRVARNVLAALIVKLKGSPCEPFGSDMGIHIDRHQIRYPDVSVLCDPRDDADELQQARFPRVLFEVFSRTTKGDDRSVKLPEYKRLESVQAIVFIDPVLETIELHERFGSDGWGATTLDQEETLPLSCLGVELAYREIFARG